MRNVFKKFDLNTCFYQFSSFFNFVFCQITLRSFSMWNVCVNVEFLSSKIPPHPPIQINMIISHVPLFLITA